MLSEEEEVSDLWKVEGVKDKDEIMVHIRFPKAFDVQAFALQAAGDNPGCNPTAFNVSARCEEKDCPTHGTVNGWFSIKRQKNEGDLFEEPFEILKFKVEVDHPLKEFKFHFTDTAGFPDLQLSSILFYEPRGPEDESDEEEDNQASGNSEYS